MNYTLFHREHFSPVLLNMCDDNIYSWRNGFCKELVINKLLEPLWSTWTFKMIRIKALDKASLENFCYSAFIFENIRSVGMKSIVLEHITQKATSDEIWRSASTVISITDIKACHLFKLLTDFSWFLNTYYFQWLDVLKSWICRFMRIIGTLFCLSGLCFKLIFRLQSSPLSSSNLCLSGEFFSLFSDYIILSYISQDGTKHQAYQLEVSEIHDFNTRNMVYPSWFSYF
jgi:hypothetical protein